MNAIRLVLSKRLGPLFGTQFFGAFNDNLFKQAVVLMVVFQTGGAEQDAAMLSSLAAGLFILPFFLFSSTAGLLSDKFDKAKVLRITKVVEIGVMALGAVGFWLSSIPILFATMFLMGAQSAFFGPAKFSILPQHLKEEEITTGNSLISMSTFVAIITGTILAGILDQAGALSTVGAVSVGIAVAGVVAAFFIPTAPTSTPNMPVSYNMPKTTWELYKISKKKPSVHLSILGLSWFWFIGATILTLAPSFTKYTLGGTASLAIAITVTFVVGIVLGSVLCILLSKQNIELGLVPLGAIGMTIFGMDLFFMNYATPSTGGVTVSEFFWTATSFQNWRVVFDLTMIAMCSELYQIPLFAMVQVRSDPKERARVIAANNVMNSLFMVGSAVVGAILATAGLSTTEIFAVVFAMNLVVAAYIFSVIPEFTMRFVVWVLARTIYRVRFHGQDLIPRNGPAVIVANHVSFIDWFIITAACGRPVRFVMHHTIFKIPVLSLFFKLAKAIPIAPAKEDETMKEQAFQSISEALADDQIVCIFPEGMITHDGQMNTFRPGIEQILQKNPVPVVPVALKGLWGSFFSRRGGKAMAKMPKPKRRTIDVVVGPLQSAESRASDLEWEVEKLLAA